MAKLRKIVYDYVANGRPSLGDKVRSRLRERKHPVAARRTNPSPLSGITAGYKERGATSINGGTFNPGPTSGMLK